MNERPLVPRESKLSATPTSLAHGCSRTNAAAPSRPASSPSVNRTNTSCTSGCFRARSARTVSSSARDTAPSSPARRPGADAVVVGHEQHALCRPASLPGQPGDDVLHAAGFLVAGADAGRDLEPGRDAERGELSDDVVAHAIVVGRADGMRPRRDRLDVAHRALGGEHGVRRRGRDRARWAHVAQNGQRGEGEESGGDGGANGSGHWFRRLGARRCESGGSPGPCACPAMHHSTSKAYPAEHPCPKRHRSALGRRCWWWTITTRRGRRSRACSRRAGSPSSRRRAAPRRSIASRASATTSTSCSRTSRCRG